MKKKNKKDMSQYYYSLDEYAIRMGGAAKLSVLLQKRTKELIKGLPKLVDTDSDDPLEIAMEELFQNKLSLKKHDDMLFPDDKKTKKMEL